jgi:4-oxalocrotonate tautomerase
MPLVRIDVLQGYSEAQHKLIGDSVQRAMMETLDVPERDRFQIISVQVTLSAGRTTEAKQAFFARLAELLGEAIALRREDLGIVLVENERPDWSFGKGEASYVVPPREQWR